MRAPGEPGAEVRVPLPQLARQAASTDADTASLRLDLLHRQLVPTSELPPFSAELLLSPAPSRATRPKARRIKAGARSIFGFKGAQATHRNSRRGRVRLGLSG